MTQFLKYLTLASFFLSGNANTYAHPSSDEDEVQMPYQRSAEPQFVGEDVSEEDFQHVLAIAQAAGTSSFGLALVANNPPPWTAINRNLCNAFGRGQGESFFQLCLFIAETNIAIPPQDRHFLLDQASKVDPNDQRISNCR